MLAVALAIRDSSQFHCTGLKLSYTYDHLRNSLRTELSMCRLQDGKLDHSTFFEPTFNDSQLRLPVKKFNRVYPLFAPHGEIGLLAQYPLNAVKLFETQCKLEVYKGPVILL